MHRYLTFSFASLAQGMVYLHKSAFQSHGYLSSANCHVDSRWVLKIAGFSLHLFREVGCTEEVNFAFSRVKNIFFLHS